MWEEIQSGDFVINQITKERQPQLYHGFDTAEQDQAQDQVLSLPRRGNHSNADERRDLDQVHDDLRSPKHLAQHKTIKPAEDLPGLGEFYCIECAKFFEGEHSLVQHRRGKNHKRRVRSLREEPYSQKEAEAAVGLRTDNGTRANTALSEQPAPMEVEQVMNK